MRMTGNLAQIIALTTFGNCCLKGLHLAADFYPKNSAFQCCKSVDFRQNKKSFLSSKPQEIVVAKNPFEWFELLTRGGCTKLRLLYFHSSNQSFAPDHMLAGFVGGGGQWYIEASYKDHFDYWADRWKVTDLNAADKLIWTVSYGLTKTQKRSDYAKQNLAESKERLATALTEIAEFAQSSELPHFANEFKGQNMRSKVICLKRTIITETSFVQTFILYQRVKSYTQLAVPGCLAEWGRGTI